MTIPWQQLEREVVSLLKEHGFDIVQDGDKFIDLRYDFPMTFNLTTFVKELARRLET